MRTDARPPFAWNWAWLLVPFAAVAAAVVTTTPGGMVVSDGELSPIPWSELFVHNLVAFGWWVVLCPFVLATVGRIDRLRAPGPVRAALQVAAGAAFVLLYFVLYATARLSSLTYGVGLNWRGLRSVLPHATAVYLVLAAGSFAALAVRSARARERRAAELQRELAEARLQVLRAQLHPHFLFNSLHAISTLVDCRPEEARRMIARLAELLREAVEFAELAEVPLTREIEWVERYVELQQLRFDDRLAVDLNVAPEAVGASVPPLILQPLVENAIRHGVEPRPEGGRVRIDVERDGDLLRLRVRDTGPGISRDPRGGGIGLRLTGDRLRSLYGERGNVTLKDAAGGGADAVVVLPFHTGGSG